MIRLLLVMVWFALSYSAWAEPILSIDVRVVDGDTIEHKGEAFRLIGFDTPETGPRAKCDAERMLAKLAKQRLTEIVTGDELDLTRVACACRKGTEGTKWCNFGRVCGALATGSKSLSGVLAPEDYLRDVASTLIDEGYARPYQCAGTKCPPRKSWCGAS